MTSLVYSTWMCFLKSLLRIDSSTRFIFSWKDASWELNLSIISYATKRRQSINTSSWHIPTISNNSGEIVSPNIYDFTETYDTSKSSKKLHSDFKGLVLQQIYKNQQQILENQNQWQ